MSVAAAIGGQTPRIVTCVVYLNDDEYKALVEERKSKAAKTTEQQ